MDLAPGWELLPNDVLDSILEKLVSIEDCIRFSAVCRTWRCVAVEYFRQIRRSSNRHDRIHQQQLPFLMFPANHNNRSRSNRRLYSMIQKKFLNFELPVPCDTRFCGSSHGWLIMVDDTFKVNLFNPFSGKTIDLPPIRRLAFEKRFGEEIGEIMLRGKEYERQLKEEYGEESESETEEDEDDDDDDDDEDEEQEEYEEDEDEEDEDEGEECAEEESVLGHSQYSIVKGVLSADPTVYPKEYVLIIIYGSEQRLAFIKSGDKDWTYVDRKTCSPLPLSLLWHMSDIIFHKKRFYALYFMGQLLSVDLNDDVSGLIVKKMTSQDRLIRPFGKSYLVESLEGGDILRVLRFYGKNKVTKGFKVYRLVECHMRCTWVEVTSLGNFALFLGDNHSVSVIASDYYGCRPNCIYFCWDHVKCSHRRLKGPHDIGVFNLEDGMVVENLTLDCSHGQMPPPIWILPTFLST